MKDCTVCGDFNVDLLKIENCSPIANYYDSMQTLALLPVIHMPTRYTDESFSLIDNIFTNKASNFEAGILTFDVSDNLPNFSIFTDYFDSYPLIKGISCRLINEQTHEDTFLRLQNYDYEIILSPDCDVALEMFNELLLREFNLCCPLHTKILNEKDRTKPWINEYIKELIKKRQNYFKLLRQLKMSRLDFNRFRKFLTDKTISSKKNIFKNFFTKLNLTLSVHGR